MKVLHSQPAPCFQWLSAMMICSSCLLAGDDAASQPIVETAWSIHIEGFETPSKIATLSLNDVGPTLVRQENPPAPESATPPVVPPAAPMIDPAKTAEETPTTIAAPIPNTDPAHDTPAILPAMSYAEAYRAVPFSRSEYEANPGYRHEAALELMFQQMRPTTVVKQYTPRAFRYPDFYQYPYARYPYLRFDIRQSAPAGIPYPLYAR